MRWKLIFVLAALKTSHDTSVPQSQGGVITVSASEKYSSPSVLERILFGSNYRREWGRRVTMPVFDIRQTNLQIVEMGGGQQTTSLELVDENGNEWVLRSVDKNVKPPKRYTKNRFVRRIIQDHVSGSYPYAGLSVPGLAKAAGVPAGEQRLYFVPDDSIYGPYRAAMANKVFILINHQPIPAEEMTTEEMLEKLKSDSGYYVDQRKYLKARLLDWLLADWDRHDDQWRWVEQKTDSGIALQVVPRDRDQAFYRSNGLLVKFIGLFFMPHLDRFNSRASGIKDLSNKAKPLDKRFTSELNKEEWETIVTEFQKNVTDSVIESAIRKQPPEIFAIRGNELIEKLKARRDGLFKHVMNYYEFLKEYSP